MGLSLSDPVNGPTMFCTLPSLDISGIWQFHHRLVAFFYQLHRQCMLKYDHPLTMGCLPSKLVVSAWWSASLSLNTRRINVQLLLWLAPNLCCHTYIFKSCAPWRMASLLPESKLMLNMVPFLPSLRSSTSPTSGNFLSILLPFYDRKPFFYTL